MRHFDFSLFEPEDIKILEAMVPGQNSYILPSPPRNTLRLPSLNDVRSEIARFRCWDMEIAPDGTPYIYRWHIVPRRAVGANVYLHLQVADDPERPLHDHPWDNQSVILAGGYREVYQHVAHGKRLFDVCERECHAGRTIHRRAEEAHRLFLLPDTPYTISLFSTGPVIRDWGFWFDNPERWISHNEVIQETPDGRSIFREPTRPT